jgi:DNA-binding NtrC family response regulator
MLHAHGSPRAEADVVRRILIVDDEPGMAKSVAIMLRRERYQVSEAVSVAAAIARLKQERHHLVITDLLMEPLDGLDLLVLLRRYQPGCPVVVMTAFATAENRSEAIRLGAVEFVDKPLQPDRLLPRIRQLLEP